MIGVNLSFEVSTSDFWERPEWAREVVGQLHPNQESIQFVAAHGLGLKQSVGKLLEHLGVSVWGKTCLKI